MTRPDSVPRLLLPLLPTRKIRDFLRKIPPPDRFSNDPPTLSSNKPAHAAQKPLQLLEKAIIASHALITISK